MRSNLTAALAVFALVLAALLPGPAEAKVYIDLQAPSVQRLPVAIQGFKFTGADPVSPEEAELVKDISGRLYETLRADLEFSALFRIIEKDAFIEDTEKFGLTYGETNFSEWRVIGADTLVKAGFDVKGDKLSVEARFFDAVREEQILGKRYVGSTESPRRLAHYFADQLYEEVTGRRGVFSTRVLFVSDRTGNKEIYLSDYDGSNTRILTRNGSINLSPRWGPEGRFVYYTSYKDGSPMLYRLDILTGRDELVSGRPGVNIGGRPSPDGRYVALTLSIDGTPQLYLKDLETGRYRRLTRSWGIDVSPAWSPDGKKIAFVSDRAGNPHLYVLDLTTSEAVRLTFDGKYNASPAWSPDGSLIAFARSESGNFNIWTIKPDGSSLTQLTYDGDNRSPSWSPDSRFIVFSSTRGGSTSLNMVQGDGGHRTVLETPVSNERSPDWGPYPR